MNVLSPEVVISLLLGAVAVLATLFTLITQFISGNDGELTLPYNYNATSSCCHITKETAVIVKQSKISLLY